MNDASLNRFLLVCKCRKCANLVEKNCWIFGAVESFLEGVVLIGTLSLF